MEIINALGRRKEAVARIYLSEGTGNITVNNKDYKDFFPLKQLQYIVEQPFLVLELLGKYDVKVVADGGGIKGQSEAIRLGITRALIKIDPEYKSTLKSNGFTTRDSRVVERKKPGRPKARKRFQFSKR